MPSPRRCSLRSPELDDARRISDRRSDAEHRLNFPWRQVGSQLLSALAALCALVLAASCASTPTGPAAEPVAPLFDHDIYRAIPDDSVYVWAWDGLPDGLHTRLERTYGAPFREMLNAAGALEPYGVLVDAADTDSQILAAVMEEFLKDGGRESIGIAQPLRLVVHSYGLWPVVRIALADPETARTRIDQLRMQFPEGWESTMLSAGSAGGAQREFITRPLTGELSFALTVTSDQLVASILPNSEHQRFVAQLAPNGSANTGAQRERLITQVGDYGVLATAVGSLDMPRMARGLFAPDVRDQPFAEILDLPVERSQVCRDDISDLAGSLPRLVWGYEQLTDSREAGVFITETTDPDFLDALKGLVSHDAGLRVAASSDADLNVSLSLDVVAASKLFLRLTKSLRQKRYRCPTLEQLGAVATKQAMEFDLAARMLLGGLRAVHVRIDKFNLSAAMEGVLAVVHDNPMSVLNRLRGVLGSVPIPATDDGTPAVSGEPGGVMMQTAVKGNLVVASLGEKTFEASKVLLERGVGAKMPLMTFAVRGAAQKFIADLGETEVTDDWLLANAENYPVAGRIQGPVATINGNPVPSDGFYRVAEAALTSDVDEPLIDGVFLEAAYRNHPEAHFAKAEREALGRIVDDTLLSEALSAQGQPMMPMDDSLPATAWPEHLQADVERRLLENFTKAGKLRVSSGAIRKHYRSNKESYRRRASAHLRHVFVSTKTGSLMDVSAARQTIDQAQEALKRGDDFAKVAETYGDAPVDIGVVDDTAFPGDFGEPVFGRKKDGLTDVVKSPTGFHIFEVTDLTRAGIPPLKDMRERIRNQLTQARFSSARGEWIAALRSTASVTDKLAEVSEKRRAAHMTRIPLVGRFVTASRRVEELTDTGEMTVDVTERGLVFRTDIRYRWR